MPLKQRLGPPCFASVGAVVIVIVAGLFTPTMARAAEGAAVQEDRRPEGPDDLPYSLAMDASITATAAGLWFGSDALKSHLAPLACRWCRVDALDSQVRNSLRWTDRSGTAVSVSNVGAYVTAPLVGFGLSALAAVHDGYARNLLVDFLVAGEAVAIAGDVSQLVKLSVGRQRPYAHAGIANPDRGQGPDDANLSFFSGHTSFAFSVAAAVGTVGWMRGYHWAPAVYVLGGLVGMATAYLRIAADQHYLTDVVTGAVVGTAVGAGAPYLLHHPLASAPASAPARAPAPASAASHATDRQQGLNFAIVPASFVGGRGISLTTVW